MQKKLTITLNERVYEGLHSVLGRRRISRFIESLVRPHVIGKDLETAYRRMAQDEAREVEALERAEGTSGDVAHERRLLRMAEKSQRREDRPSRRCVCLAPDALDRS